MKPGDRADTEGMSAAAEPWARILGADPRPWLLDSDEAPARWVTLTALNDLPGVHPDVRAERAAAVSSPMVQALLDRLPPWGEDTAVSGHDRPAYLPNMLALLADLGLRGGDDDRVERALDGLCAHQDDGGRFLSFGRAPKRPEPLWGSLPCDTHIITEVLVRYGRADDPATRLGLARIAADLASTPQGSAWTCIPDPAVGFRGPGRKGDVCPQVSLEALRTFARLPPNERPAGLEDAARTLLGVWRDRGAARPYMFGHGYRFKTVKWPAFWYSTYWELDTLGRYPDLWRRGAAADRRALAELVACLVAYNVSPDGTVTPRSTYQGFSRHSFGQKKEASPVATAWLAAVVRRFSELAGEVAAVDVTALGSSTGGTGTPRPPRT